ncbi:MAG: excinuclease ABC subunit C [Rikenellaceae bacterium]|nr:excinuclease ABC subunit C [Rikenellaceae bacterium]
MESSTKRELKEQVSLLPLLPGCYIFSDKSGEIIYVGKAKSLKKRVSSYFVDSRDHSPKVRAMVRQIASLRYIIVDSETDALLLENSLIKSHKPRYNILLKDDKSYPWIALTPPPFERVISTRRVVKDGSRYFGPYASISTQKAVLEFIAEVIPLRTCRHNLSQEMIDRGKYAPCLQYHIGNCKAPCCGKQSLTEYAELVNLTVSILKGDLRPVKNYLEGEMTRAAAELRFEAAHRFKMQLEALEKYRSKSVIVSANITDADIFSLYIEGEEAYCNFLRVKGGAIVAVQTLAIEPGVDATEEQMLTLGIQHFVDNIAGELQREVIVPLLPEVALFEGVTFTIPQRGEKRELLAFSQRTARLYRAELMKNMEIKNPERHADRIMEAMQRELRLDRQPRHIECFDNSNTQGTNPVASCVVFRNGKPSKREYRHFNIKTVVGADDFASMREILTRRYTRLVEEGAELPDLIVVDGGKGQLSSAYAVLCELGLESRIPIVGLAKRLEEVYYPNDPMPYYLSRTGEPLKVMCHIRDEAHRFGITFHRSKRNNAMLRSSLEDIEGVGSKSVESLFKHFKSLTKIKAATVDELAEVVGRVRAEKIYNHFHNEK